MIIPPKQQALIDIAMSQVGVHEEGGNNQGPVVELYQRVIGRPEKEPWCVSFIQWCVREVDKKFNCETILFPTESSQLLWYKTPQVSRITIPDPGCVVVWTKYKNETPLSIGHVGIVREILGDGYMLTVEGNTSPDPSAAIIRDSNGQIPDGVYLKRRKISQTVGYMRTAGFLLPWAG